MYEAIIGIWKYSPNNSNSLSAVVEQIADGIVDGNEFRCFWIEWNDGIVRVGHEGQKFSFLMYHIEPFEINFHGIRTHPPGNWFIYKTTHIWVPD